MNQSRLQIPQQRALLVDAARGLAALAVVLYHAVEGKHLQAAERAAAHFAPADWAMTVVRHGHLGVPVFFVISGFVIAHSLASVTIRPREFGQFVLRRVARLDPPYWASIVLVIVMAELSKRMLHKPEAGDYTPGRMLAHLFYAQDIAGMKPLSGVYWTLCMEVQFYLVFALLLGIAQWLQRGLLAARPGAALAAVFGSAAALSLLWPLGILHDNVARGLFPPLWHGFLLGATCCWAVRGTVPRWAFFAFAGAVLVGAGVRQESFAVTCGVTAFVFYVASRSGVMNRWPTARPVLLLGTISYSLYLTHNPIAGAAFRIVGRLTGPTAAGELVAALIVTALCVAFAWAFYQCVERPSMLLAKRIGRRPAVTVAPVPERPTMLAA